MYEEQIKAQLKLLGLDDILADSEKISKIAAKVTKEEDVAKAVHEYAKDVEADRRVTKALDTATKKFQKQLDDFQAKLDGKKPDAGDNKDGDNKPKPDDNKAGQTGNQDMTASITEAVKAAIAPIAERIAAIEQKSVKATQAEVVAASLKKAGLPDKLAAFVALSDGDTEETIAEKVNGLKTIWTETNQAAVDEKLKAGGIPPLGGVTAEQASAAVVELAKESPYAAKPKQ